MGIPLKKRVIISIIVSIAIILALLWLANPTELWVSITKTNINLILLVLVLYFINLLTKSYRWYLLVNSTGIKVPYLKILPYFLIGLALNNVTIGKLGGEPVRAYLLTKGANVSVGQGIASIFTEKILDIVVITTIAIIGVIFILPLLPYDAARNLIIILIIVVFLIISLLVIVSKSKLMNKTVDKTVSFALKISKSDLTKRFTNALTGFTDKFKFGTREILKAKKTTGACIFLTVIIWINEALRLFIILLALPETEKASLGAVFIASSIANILSLIIPLGAGNILGIETVLLAVGLDPATAAAASILQVATSLWISVPFGAVAMLAIGFKLSDSMKTNGNVKKYSSVTETDDK